MTANWKIVRNTIMWLLVAVMTLGIVIASPYTVRSNAASAKQTVVVAKDKNGTWGAIKNGKIDTSVTGVYKNANGWWYVKNGVVRFDYTGFQKNEYGWWRIENGNVNFKANSIYKNPDNGGWYKTTNGKVTWNENGIYKNANGWYKTTNSRVTFKENGVFKNDNGWWYVKNSKVDFSYTGIASNKNGTWYINKGGVDFKKTGIVTVDGKLYDVEKGRATEADETIAQAIAEIKDFLDIYPTSRSMVIDLFSDPEDPDAYTRAVAEYAADHADIDWDTQAVLYCADALDPEGIGTSRKLLLMSLEEEGFTKSQIDKAMAIVDDDAKQDPNFWNKQALLTAQFFQAVADEDDQTLDMAELKTALVDELYYTESQAQYAVDHLK